MKEPKDKRTKNYKEWRANFEKENTIGLGDVIENITKATGIKKLVETFTPEGEDCGCDDRKAKVNKRWRFSYSRSNVRCFTEELYNKWTELKPRAHKQLSTEDYQLLVEIGIRLFAQDNTKQIKSCGSCVDYLITDINRVYEAYQEPKTIK